MSKAIPEAAVHTDEQAAKNFDGFESSVLEAAQQQAKQIADEAAAESEAIYNKLIRKEKGDPVAEHRSHTEAAYRRKVAATKQENTKKLLVYRKQLVNGLFAEASESVEEFTQTKDYSDFLTKLLAPYAAQAADGCTVLLREADMTHKAALAKLLPKAEFIVDSSIVLGGAKLRIGRILYDETLSERLRAERAAFVSRCKLRVNAAELEQADENE